MDGSPELARAGLTTAERISTTILEVSMLLLFLLDLFLMDSSQLWLGFWDQTIFLVNSCYSNIHPSILIGFIRT